MLLVEAKRLTEGEAPGPHPGFSLAHALYAILIMGTSVVGRQRLAATLGLGEGSARTLLKKMKKMGIIITDRKGCHLTPRGIMLYNEAIRSFFTFIPSPKTVPRGHPFGVVIRSGAKFVGSGLKERDEAVKAGAEGAMTLVYTRGSLLMPELSDLTKEHPELATEIIKAGSLNDGDAVIIAWGPDPASVVYGALSAAWIVYEKMSASS
jgi:hypothetical protein